MDKSLYLGLGVSLLALLTGCGGGGGGGGGSDPAPDNSTARAGLYLGEITQGDSTGDSTLLLAVAPDGSARLIEQAPGTYAKGNINFNANGAFSGTIDEYQLGRPFSSGTISGTSTLTSFSGDSFDSEGNKLNSFTFDRVAQLSDIPASTSKIAGNWTDVRDTTPTTSIAIDSGGALNGGNGSCQYDGLVTVPDSAINLYEVNFTATCSSDGPEFTAAEQEGEYQGYSYYAPASESDPEKLVFLADNGKISRYFVFEK